MKLTKKSKNVQKHKATKCLIIFLILTFISNTSFSQKTFNANIILDSQVDVDVFGLLGYEIVNGDIRIAGDVTSLISLRTIRKINNLIISNAEVLENLTGLEHITELNGSLEISQNDNLKDISALKNLTKIGESEGRLSQSGVGYGNFDIVGNHNLTEIDLPNLEYIGLNFTITDNIILKNINGFDKLKFIGNRLQIYNNNELEYISGFNQLIDPFSINIFKEKALLEISGFSQLKIVNYFLAISNNNKLNKISGFNILENIQNNLEIAYNKSLIDLTGLNQLIKVKGSLIITNNDLLADFCPLKNLIQNPDSIGLWTVRNNKSNPTIEDLMNSSCIDQDNDGYDSNVDCDDLNPNINPGAEEILNNNIDENCDGQDSTGRIYYRDMDGDGWGSDYAPKSFQSSPSALYPVSKGGDCNDSHTGINEGKSEVFNNGIDENCDGYIEADRDYDGYGELNDCNDNNSNINPNAVEIPNNNIDENCNGLKSFTYFQDKDGDGFGNSTQSVDSEIQPSGFVLNGLDCDDNNANINPDAYDIPNNGIDENCADGDSVLSIDNIELTNLLKIFPNPTSNHINITTNNYVQLKYINIFNIYGKLIINIKGNVQNINLNKIPNGIYFIELKTDKGKLTKKIIKRGI